MGSLIGLKATSHPLKAAIAHLRDFLNGAEKHHERGVYSVDLPVDRAGAKALRRLLDLADAGRNSRQRATALGRNLRVLNNYPGKNAVKLAKLLEVSQGTAFALEKALDGRDRAIGILDARLDEATAHFLRQSDNYCGVINELEAERDRLRAQVTALTGSDEVTKS